MTAHTPRRVTNYEKASRCPCCHAKLYHSCEYHAQAPAMVEALQQIQLDLANPFEFVNDQGVIDSIRKRVAAILAQIEVRKP